MVEPGWEFAVAGEASPWLPSPELLPLGCDMYVLI